MQKVGRYEVLRELARGGMGAVLLARDPRLGRQVAIKVLVSGASATELQRRRFEAEAKAMARLHHPNIVSVHEVGAVRETPYLVMDLVEGESLQDKLERDGPLPVDEALELAAITARALAHAHAQGLLHRDVKPSNILLGKDGIARLGDFGLVKDLAAGAAHSALTRTGALLGTPGFLPHEQAMGGTVGPPADVYALGATLYAMLTGQPPYEADDLVVLIGSMQAPPPAPSKLRKGVPRAVDDLVLRCLSPDPRARPGPMADLVEELEALRAAPPPVEGRRLPVAAAVAGVALLTGAGAGLLALRGADPAPRPPATEVASVAPPPATAPAVPPATEPPVTEAPATEAPKEHPGVVEARAALAASQPEKALQAAERALIADGEDTMALVLRADARLQLRDAAGAARDLTKAYAIDPHPTIALRRAFAWKTLGEPQRVIDDCARVLEAQPNQANALGLRGWARARLGDQDGALADYTAAIQIEPRADWLEATGIIELGQGHADIARRDFELALKLDPEAHASRFNLAQCLQLQGDLEGAERLITEVLERVPGLAQGWVRRAQLRRELGRHGAAVEDATRALDLELRVDALTERATCLEKLGRTAEALADLARALEHEPANGTTLYNRGTIRLRHDDAQGALVDLDAAIAAKLETSAVYSNRAEAREALGDDRGAAADYERAAELDPRSASSRYNAGIVWGRLGEHAKARDAYSRAIEIDPGMAVAWLNRAESRRLLGDAEGNLTDLARAIELAPETVTPWAARAVVHHRANRHAEARPDYDRACALEPDNTALLYNRGLCLESLGDLEAARRDWEKLLTLVGKDDPQWRRAKGKLDALDRKR